ncbi:MAG TPA: type II toxin-antitoxin system HicB family antitoxin [Solirubrobacterales bacterium]|nr:type II toxin-antitoxin system HicB family antitoxin [Solirubrobacterales bacterium]
MAAASVDFTISFDNPDEKGWIVARVLEVPGAMSQGRTREEARENALDALRTVLAPDEELAGETPEADRGHLRLLPQREAPRPRTTSPRPRLPRDRRL